MRVFHYENLDSLKAYLNAFITAYNFAKYLKSLRWRTPLQVICDAWTKDPIIFAPPHLGITHLELDCKNLDSPSA